MATVRLDRVSKRYEDGSWGVHDVSLDIADREFLVLVGPSGCGKSTTLRLIAGLETCTDGSVEMNGRRVNDLAPTHRDIAMVFQNYALYPHMTVYRNIGFGLELQRGGWFGYVKRMFGRGNVEALTRVEIDRRIRQTAEKLGIEKLLNKKPHQLSGGERQRVALGRAIARKPAAFLFDEPLSNLDAKLRGQMRTELKRLHNELNSTMIFVTHDQVEAMTLGDRIAVMNQGRLNQVGSPAEIYERPANEFVAGFIGNHPINLVSGRVELRNNQMVFGNEDFEAVLLRSTEQRIREEAVRATDGLIASQAGVGKQSSVGKQIRVGMQVKLGFRPEDVSVVGADLEVSANEEGLNKGTVEEVDQLGDSVLLHLKVGDGLRILARVSNRHERVGWSQDQVVRFLIDPQRLHVFDGDSGDRIELGVDSFSDLNANKH